VFLEEFGYGRPPVDEVDVRMAYATLSVRIPRAMLHELVLTVYPTPIRSTMFAMFACEDDTYMVLAGTVGGQDLPTDRAALLDFIAKIAPAHAVAAARAGEPLGDVAQHRIPSDRWRRYDKLPRTPDGRRPLSTRITNAYMDRVLTATETDPAVAQQFFRTVWMLDEPTSLLRPRIVLGIVKALVTGARNREQAAHLESLNACAD
jgi:hypothetical protein